MTLIKGCKLLIFAFPEGTNKRAWVQRHLYPLRYRVQSEGTSLYPRQVIDIVDNSLKGTKKGTSTGARKYGGYKGYTHPNRVCTLYPRFAECFVLRFWSWYLICKCYLSIIK